MSTPAPTRNLVILGMHRSGTSMVAGALAAGGLQVGNTGELMPAQADNPRGFWERQDVVALNEKILADSGRSWFNPGPLDGAATDYRAEIEAVFSALGPGPWLLKDPRLVVTWPLWRAALADPVLLFVYRSPEAVASSLFRRNGFPFDFGLALWEFYNRHILEIAQGRDLVTVAYEQLVSDPEQGLAALQRDLSALGVPLVERLLADSFDQSLNHGAGISEAIDQLVTPAQRQLADACLALAAQDPGKTTTLPAVGAALQLRITNMAQAFQQTRLAQQAETELADSLVDRSKLQAALDALEVDHRALAEAHHASETDVAQVRRERTTLQTELDSEREALTVARGDYESLDQQFQGEVSRLTGLCDERAQDVVRLSAETRDLSAKAEFLFSELGLTYSKLLAFSGSVPGSLQRWSTTVYKWLSFRPRQRTALDDVLASAQAHQREFGGGVERADNSRLRLFWEVLKYILANPAGSLRSMSLPRLKRAIAVFLNSESEDLTVWVKQRFPVQEGQRVEELPELDASLDSLELAFPVSEQPRVSIVVPVYNEYRTSMYCLRSLLEHTGDVDYEVIFADDNSTDLTHSIGQRVTGLRLSRQPDNQGFLRNCNAAAAMARGEFLVFLNNDTALTDGWLSAMLGTFEGDDSIGVVGPKLLFPNGSLQEAGGIIWDDASGWNFGREDAADKPAYNYLKETDYVSGACLMVRRELWQQLGGFDERFVPAYYEDTDFCFAVREQGMRVVYQPDSTVIHFEGVSNGTDLNAGIKRYQLENQQRFADKWRSELHSEHFINSERVFNARDRSRHRRCVLVIDHYVPSYDKDAGSRSTWQYLRLLVDMGYNVKFIGANFFPHAPYTQALQQLGIEVLVGEYMARNLDRWLREHAADIDAIYLHRPHVAEQFLPSLERMEPRPPVIFFGHDLHCLRARREQELLGDAATIGQAEDWRKREYAVFQQVDHIWYPSQVEVDEILASEPGLSVTAIPLYVVEPRPVPAYDPATRQGMLFVGGFNHPPNADGIRWFIDEVLPLVRARCPQLSLQLVGSSMPEEIRALRTEGVEILGFLSDEKLDELYQNVKLAIVPLRYGAGVKGKVIEALQQGLPLVTTAVGAEGLPEPASVMQLADDAAAFAERIIAIEGADPAALALLDGYPAYLQENFSRQRAEDIVRRHFGDPVRER